MPGGTPVDPALLARVRAAVDSVRSLPVGPPRDEAIELLSEIRSNISASNYREAESRVARVEELLRPAPAAAPAVSPIDDPYEEVDLGPRTPAAPRSARTAWTAPTWLRLDLPRRLVGRISRPTRVRLAVSLFLGLVFAIAVGLAAGWRLLYGIDTPGIYLPQDFWFRPAVDVAIPCFVSLLDGSNPYATLYVTLAIEGIVAAFCIQLLTAAVLRRTFTRPVRRGVEAVAAALYLSNPYILSFGTTSLLSNVLISNSAFIAFLALLIVAVDRINRGGTIGRGHALLIGLTIGLASPYAFPNLLRIQAMVLFALLIALLLLLVTPRAADPGVPQVTHPLRSSAVRLLLFGLPLAALLLAYPLGSSVETYLVPAGPLNSIISSQPFIQATAHNTFPMVIRLLGKGTLHTFAYASVLSGYSIEAVASWLWPVFALAVPIVAWAASPRGRFLSTRTVVVLELIAWICVAWSCGPNLPFGPVVEPITSAFPKLLYAFPYYYPEYQVLTLLYPILAAISLGWIGIRLGALGRAAERRFAPIAGPSAALTGDPRGGFSGRRTRPSYLLPRLAVLVLTVLLLLVAVPVYNGTSLAASGRVTPGGFTIPAAYTELRPVLNQLGGNALLLPGVQSHIQTSWGYDGSANWYTLYYYPTQVIQPAYYGPFQILQPATASAYANLTAPLVPAGATSNISGTFSKTIGPTLGAGGASIWTWNIPAAKNQSWREPWVNLTFDSTNPTAFASQQNAGNIQVGLATNTSTSAELVRHLSWFPVLNSSSTIVTNVSAGVVRVSVFVTYPPAGGINLNQVLGVELRILGNVSGTSMGLTLGSAFAIASTSIVPSWHATLLSAGVQTLLTDTSLVNGTNVPDGYGVLTASLANSTGIARYCWSSGTLALYQLLGDG